MRISILLADLEYPPSSGHQLGLMIFEMVNVGNPVLQFQNFPIIPKVRQAIMISAETKKINLIASLLFCLNREKLNKMLECAQRPLPVESTEVDIGQDQKPHSIILISGQPVQKTIKYDKKWLNFFKKGRRFFIEDTLGKRYYLPKKKTKNIKDFLAKKGV